MRINFVELNRGGIVVVVFWSRATTQQ